MKALLIILIITLQSFCNELGESVLKFDAEIVDAITSPKIDKDKGSIRKKVLRLELSLDEIADKLKDGDEEGRNAVNSIIEKGGMLLTKIDYVNDSLLMAKFKWGEERCDEFKYNLYQLCYKWHSLEGGVVNPTTKIYIHGRNRTAGGMQYIERYM